MRVLFAWDASRVLVRFAAASRAKTDGFKLESSVCWPIKLETSHAHLNCSRSVFRPLGLLPSSGNNVLQTFYADKTSKFQRRKFRTRLFKTDAILPDRVNPPLQNFLRNNVFNIIVLFFEKITIRNCNNNSKLLVILSATYFPNSKVYLCHRIWRYASLVSRGERCIYKYDNTTKSNEHISRYHM